MYHLTFLDYSLCALVVAILAYGIVHLIQEL